MITHYDLFAGIGGFSLALEEVFDEPIRHIFCEWERFPATVLKKHWPDAEYWGDIHDLNIGLELGIITPYLCQDHAHIVKKNLEQIIQIGENSALQKQQGKGSTAAKSDTKNIKQEFVKLLENLEKKSHKLMGTVVPVAEKSSRHFSQSTTLTVVEQKNEKKCPACNFTAILEPTNTLAAISSFATTVITENIGLDNVPTKIDTTIVTGGFPCQPFSHAGRRAGTADARWLWPEMLRVIKTVRPDWVIAENVAGFVSWDEGMAFETVCLDLEAQNYETRAFIIPAVAVNAPHRRDRVWIIARNPANAGGAGLEETGTGVKATRSRGSRNRYPDWSRDWKEVAFATCDDSVDDGLSRIVDGVSYSRAKWRKESLKAYGNAIVPQVAIEIIKAIKFNEDKKQ